MSVFINRNTKVLVQGITGTQASFHVQRIQNYGTKIVAGVVPHKRDDFYLGVPVFSTVKEAKEKTGATASLIFVPARFVKSAILEAIEAQLDLVVAITSGIPVNDMLEIKQALSQSKTLLIGPNTPGIITPQEAYLGIFPDNIHKSGEIGIVSRSSTLTYEVILEINKAGLGESTVVGLGDDFIIGTGFVEVIERFNNDAKTKAIVLIGGSGGHYEIEAAQQYAKMQKKKKVISLMINEPQELYKDIGLASDIICRGITTHAEKKKLMIDSGMIVVDSLSELICELSKL